MAKRLRKFRDSDWEESTKQEKEREKHQKSRRSKDRKQRISDKDSFYHKNY